MNLKEKLYQYTNLMILVLIVLVGLHMRIVAVIETEVSQPVHSDAREYVLYAYNLKTYGIYSRSLDGILGEGVPAPDAARPPGYPLFLGLFFSENNLKKNAFIQVLFAQAFLGTVVIILTYLIFANTLGKLSALFIAALTALSSHLININIYLLSESLFCFLLIVWFYLFNRLYQTDHQSKTQSENQTNKKYLFIFVSGLILAYASLTRPWLQYFIIFFIPFYYMTLNTPERIKSILVFVGAFLTLWAAWMVRNQMALDGTEKGSVLISSVLHGMYPDIMYRGDPKTLGYPYRFDPNMQEITGSLSSLLMEIKSRFETRTWEHIHWYLFGKPLHLFSWQYIQGNGSFVYSVKTTPYITNFYFILANSAMKGLHNILMILAWLGSILVWLPQNRTKIKPEAVTLLRAISLLLIYFSLIHMLVAPLPRYAVPIRPLMFGMAFVPFLVFKNQIWNPIRTPKEST